MKAIVSELWQTGREIISIDGNEFDRPKSFSDLKKCDNVLIGDNISGTKIREVLIDNSIVIIEATCVKHPQGGTMYVLEVC